MSEQIPQQNLHTDPTKPPKFSTKLDYEFNSEILKALEWHTEFPDLTWAQVQEKLIEENSSNKDKPWRIPTVEELIFAQENNIEGFDRSGGGTYWCTDFPVYKNKEAFNSKTKEHFEKWDQAYYINMFNGGIFSKDKKSATSLRLVR